MVPLGWGGPQAGSRISMEGASLHDAAVLGDTRRLEALIKEGADLNALVRDAVHNTLSDDLDLTIPTSLINTHSSAYRIDMVYAPLLNPDMHSLRGKLRRRLIKYPPRSSRPCLVDFKPTEDSIRYTQHRISCLEQELTR